MSFLAMIRIPVDLIHILFDVILFYYDLKIGLLPVLLKNT